MNRDSTASIIRAAAITNTAHPPNTVNVSYSSSHPNRRSPSIRLKDNEAANVSDDNGNDHERTSAMTASSLKHSYSSIGTEEMSFLTSQDSTNDNTGRRCCPPSLSSDVVEFFQKFKFGNNILAGLSVSIMLIPQSMSYAKLAGLPVQYGLYSGCTPLFLYAMLGTCRQLAVGPVALVSSLLLLNNDNNDDPELDQYRNTLTEEENEKRYQTMAMQTAMLVGMIYLLMGVFRLGFITVFLSHAVVSGFTSGAAIWIGLSQLKYFVGCGDISSSGGVQNVVLSLWDMKREWDTRSILLGIGSLTVLIGIKLLGGSMLKDVAWIKSVGPLLVSVFGIVFVYLANCMFNNNDEGNGGYGNDARTLLVGEIPSGLPSFNGQFLFSFPGNIPFLLRHAVPPIVLIGFMESIAISKKMAAIHKYEIDASSELIALGMANVAGALFQSYPITGSFSRSAVNNESGATSRISGAVTGAAVLCVLAFMTPLFEKLPLAVLASIVVSGVMGLVDYQEALYLFRVHKLDFCIWTIAFLGTMFIGVESGLVIAVSTSLLIVLYESAYPHTSVLGRLPGTKVYRNIKQYPMAERYEGIVMVRVDGPLYFANVRHVQDKLDKYESEADRILNERQKEQQREADLESALTVDKYKAFGNEHIHHPALKVKFMVWELCPVSHIDTTALHFLCHISHDYKSRGMTLCLVNPNRKVMKKLTLSEIANKSIGRENIFVSMHQAVDACLSRLDDDFE